MRINLGLYGEFVPTWNDNDKEKEKIKIWYKRITGELAASLIRFSLDRSMIFDNVAIVRNCVINIENLEDNKGEKINTAEKLLKSPGVSGLVTEIGNHILLDSQMTADEEKKIEDELTLVQ